MQSHASVDQKKIKERCAPMREEGVRGRGSVHATASDSPRTIQTRRIPSEHGPGVGRAQAVAVVTGGYDRSGARVRLAV